MGCQGLSAWSKIAIYLDSTLKADRHTFRYMFRCMDILSAQQDDAQSKSVEHLCAAWPAIVVYPAEHVNAVHVVRLRQHLEVQSPTVSRSQ